MKHYLIHGLTLRSEISLPAAELEATEAAELTIEYGPSRPIPWQAGPGELLALYESAGSGFALSAEASGYTIRFYGLCDFALRGDLSHITVFLAPDANESIASLLLGSNVLSCVLSLQDECMLHASALQLGATAIAFIGPSGSGKSTLAAALAPLGLPLITDDALRCSLGPPARCFTGARELRLRDGSEPLLNLYRSDTLRSIDGRTVVRPNPTREARLDLSALLQPELHPGNEIEIRRLRGSQAMLATIAAGRITWWRSTEIRREQFSMLTRLCKSVPVYVLALPQGIAFSAEGRRSILDAIQRATLIS